jgi:hypothetical protein
LLALAARGDPNESRLGSRNFDRLAEILSSWPPFRQAACRPAYPDGLRQSQIAGWHFGAGV